MSIETNKAIVRRFVEAMSRVDHDEIGNLLAGDVVYHNPPLLDQPLDHGEGVEGRKEFMTILSAVFPRHEETIEDLIAEGDKVVVRWSTQVVHEGSYKKGIWSAAPTGKELTVTGITIYRIADGKVVESWANWDHTVLVGHLRAAAK